MGDTLIRFNGTAFVERDLENGDEVHITVATTDGTVIADSFGKVASVTHRPRRDDETVIERIHTVKVT